MRSLTVFIFLGLTLVNRSTAGGGGEAIDLGMKGSKPKSEPKYPILGTSGACSQAICQEQCCDNMRDSNCSYAPKYLKKEMSNPHKNNCAAATCSKKKDKKGKIEYYCNCKCQVQAIFDQAIPKPPVPGKKGRDYDVVQVWHQGYWRYEVRFSNVYPDGPNGSPYRH